LKKNREVPFEVFEILKRLPVNTPPMNMLSTGISILAGYDDLAMKEMSIKSETEVSIRIIAKIATLAASIARIKEKEEIISPDNSLSHAANLLYMITGEKPDDFYEKAMNTVLITHMDHGLNASTFTSLAIHSGLSDMYSSIAGSIGCLKGLLHGGANERVIHALREIGTAEKAEKWYRNQRKLKRRIYGFGHRVYRAYDPRARLLKDFILTFCLDDENLNLCEIAEKLEKLAVGDLGKKGIFPNVDWRSGQVYLYLGIPVYLFTPLFAVGRVVGWTARILEYMAENRILRPRAHYYGPLDVEYVPIDKR
jgi:citrate synthase